MAIKYCNARKIKLSQLSVSKVIDSKEEVLTIQIFQGLSPCVWAVVTTLTSSHSQSASQGPDIDCISEIKSISLSLRMLIDATLQGFF